MTKRTRQNNENELTDDNCLPEKPEPKRYCLRKRSCGGLAVTTNTAEPKDQLKKITTNIQKKTCPFIQYNGKIEYYTEFDDITKACEQLFKWVDEHEFDKLPIAFDMEWPFSFQTGSGKSAVIQLCADINLCYIFHINNLTKLPKILLDLLYHKKVILHGICVKNDCRKLQRDYPNVDSQLLVDKCRDLGVWYNSVANSSGRWSMERLVMKICKLQINKEDKVRRSKWDIQPLSKEQCIYAAIDVYISQVMYLELDQREREKLKKEQEFIEQFGEEAFKEMEKLK